MDITHPRRILLLSTPETPESSILTFLTTPEHSLTSKPHPVQGSSAAPKPEGLPLELIHHINTAYYTASIPIWTDSISSPTEWATEWKSMDGAADVVCAVGAWIVVFERPRDQKALDNIKTLLQSVADVVSHHSSSNPYSSSEAALLAISLPQKTLPALEVSTESWEEVCLDVGGWEYIDSEAKGKNEYGERQGLERLREALEAAEWDAGGVDGNEGDVGEDDIDQLLQDLEKVSSTRGSTSNGKVLAGVDRDLELQDELRGLSGGDKDMSEPILAQATPQASSGQNQDNENEDDEDEVEDLQRMLLKLQAARDLGTDLPQAERRKLAAKAVKEVMNM